MKLQRISLLSLLFLSINAFAAPAYLLFGGDNHDKFLGCLNCNQFDPNSIWNEFGTYGSEFSSDSIWDEFGTYGSEFSSYSPWDEFSNSGPVIVDSQGNYYGKFTINEFDDQTRLGFASWILKNHKYVIENKDKIRDNF